MKKRIIVPLFAIIVIFVLNGNLSAQRLTRTTDGANDMLTVNSISTPISNLFIVDSISHQEQGRAREFSPPIMHLASFEMPLVTEDVINILKMLYAGTNGQQVPSLVITKLNSQGLAVDEREFTMVTMKEINFLELNAASREAPKAKVVIQAQDALYHDSPANRAVNDAGRLSRMTTGNKFTFVVSGITAEDVMQVGNLKIVSSARPTYMHFNLDVPTGSAKAWSDWFNSAGNRQTKEATISVLDATGTQVILSIELSQLEIVSISTRNNPGNIARTTIGLRTNQMPAVN